MILKNMINQDITLKFTQFTQIIGNNIELKNNIYDYIYKYFSNYKYSDLDLKKYNNKYPEIYINDLLISKNEFKLININSIDDIDNHLKNLKSSLLNNVSEKIFMDISIQNDCDNISNYISRIGEKLKEQILLNTNSMIDVDSKIILSSDLFKNYISTNIDSTKTTIEKLLIILDFVYYLSKKDDIKHLIYINNIDSLLNLKDYNILIKNSNRIINNTNSSIIINSTREKYIVVDNIELQDINIINDKVYCLPSYDEVIKYFNNSYPSLEKIDYKYVKSFILEYGSNIYDRDYKYKQSSFDILLILLNELKFINSNKVEEIKINDLEKQYLNLYRV